jgi:hypothetical protein
VRVPVLIQHAKRISRVVWSSVAFLDVKVFPHYPIKGTVFEKKKCIKHELHALISSTFVPKYFLILRRIQKDTIINVK